MKKVFALSGSTRKDSSNLQIIKAISKMAVSQFDLDIYQHLADLPHFNPDLDMTGPPPIIIEFRKQMEQSDGILICTPEYVFSLPGALKNALEWLVSTMVLSEKPAALITASGLGEKAHESLQLNMKTIGAAFSDKTALHISGARKLVNENYEIIDPQVHNQVQQLIDAFAESMNG